MDLDPARRVFAERRASGAAPRLAWGVLAGGELVGGEDVDTAYRIASCTKSFTAAALLILRDAGLVDLDAPITEWVPALRLRPATAGTPALRHLLTMSAGLANDDPWADRQEAMSDDDFDATCVGGVRLLWAPGSAFEYSNLGYALLGRVVQVAAGRRYHEFVTEELLRPLGLTSTSFTAPSCEVAIGFDKQGDEWVELPFSGPGAFSPIGGLFSTVTDLAKWMRWLMGDDDGPLGVESRREMSRGVQLRAAEGEGVALYGFGLVEVHHPEHGTFVYHSGGYPGFSAHMRWHPTTGLGIVALENATYAGVSVPAAAALHALLAGPPVEPWSEVLAAQQALTAMIRTGWDGSAAALFTANVAEDRSFARRRAELATALERTGVLGEVVDESSATPAHRAWTIRGEHADLAVDISMHPLDPPLVQWFDVEVRPHE